MSGAVCYVDVICQRKKTTSSLTEGSTRRQSEVKFVKVASYCDRQKTASLTNYQQGLEAVLVAFDRSDAIHVQSSRVQAISRAGK